MSTQQRPRRGFTLIEVTVSMMLNHSAGVPALSQAAVVSASPWPRPGRSLPPRMGRRYGKLTMARISAGLAPWSRSSRRPVARDDFDSLRPLASSTSR